VFVKICGTTTEEDALLAVAMGADAVGFIFAPSPRQVSPNRVRDIVRRLPPEVLTVGVFRNELPERVVEVVNASGLRGAQLHGRETPDQAQFVKERVPVLFQAFVAGDPNIRKARDYGADAVLLDSPSPGSGEVFDWRLTDGVPDGVRLLMAGGLGPANVSEAIARVHPWGVDVVTGVESSPGQKDPVKVREFIASAKGAEPPRHQPVTVTDGPYDWEEGGS
jgi:phosphoribosylanthranilate isomerase